MPSRLDLHNELIKFIPSVYFQPPADLQMTYPCIVYRKTNKMRHFGNNIIYLSQQMYKITLIEKNPDSAIADNIESHFQHCVIDDRYPVDNLNHTFISLYY